MATRDGRILEELIYDRVRSNVNLCQLVVIEQELDDSIRRAADDDHSDDERSPNTSEHLAETFLDRAWQRLEQEWRRLRVELGCATEPAERGDPRRRDPV